MTNLCGRLQGKRKNAKGERIMQVSKARGVFAEAFAVAVKRCGMCGVVECMADSFDRLRTGSSTPLRFAQDDDFLERSRRADPTVDRP
jgi:hypothetical protein